MSMEAAVMFPGIPLMGFKVLCKGLDGLMVLAFGPKQKTPFIQVKEQGDIILATPGRCFINAYAFHLGMVSF